MTRFAFEFINMKVGFALLFSFLLLVPGDDPPYPTDYFRSPLGIPLRLTGSFAEMRSNHFHSGLDIRTNAKVGYRVYAAADGWVARIVVSPYGFGHALYIQHPNGYMTVYGHLSTFNQALNAYVKRLQYQNESFSVEAFPEQGAFPVKKGEVVALSGNSGSSGGPHLHFEIRDARTQWPVNPQLFGLPIEDTIPPRLRYLKVYAADSNSHAIIRKTTGQTETVTMNHPVGLTVTGAGDTYRVDGLLDIQAHGRIGFGLEQRDNHNGSGFRLGAYRIELRANEDLLYGFEAEKLSFSLQRYMNAHIDYEERQRNRRWLQRSYQLPGNTLPYYTHAGNGWLRVEPGAAYVMAYRVEDARGNASRLEFNVSGLEQPTTVPLEPRPYATLVPHDAPHAFRAEGVALSFPAGALYEDLPMTYRNRGQLVGSFSDLHQIHDPYTPVHKRYTLSIAVPDLPARLRSKAVVAAVNEEGNVSSVGGEYHEGYVSARVRSFGSFVVVVDTLAPVIRPGNIRNERSMRGANSIRIDVRDDLSGLNRYAGYVDDEWVLFTYDPKQNLLEHVFDERIGPGRHTLRFEARDNVGNTSQLRLNFSR